MKKLFKKRFTIEDLNLSRLVCDLQNLGVELFDVSFCSAKTLTFSCYNKDCHKVVAYLEKKCYNVTNIEKIGVLSFVDTIKKHFVTAVIFFLLTIFLCVKSNFCSEIIIYAPQEISQQVEQAIADTGVSKGTLKKKISFDELENAVCVAIPTIKYTFASFSGTRLIIRVEMRAIPDAPVDNTTPRDIIANDAGVVTRILVINGTPLVKVGDSVKKGQILIKGETLFPDGNTIPTRAMGEVWATTEITQSIKFTPTTIELLPTGGVITRHRLKIGNYYTEYSKEVDYSYFTTETTQSRLFPVGIVVEFEKIYEMHQVEKIRTLQEVLPDLQLQAHEKLKEQLNGREYDDVTYGVLELSPNDVFVTATAHITQNIAIGG